MTDQQYDKFKEGQTVYLDGLIDKKDRNTRAISPLIKRQEKQDFLLTALIS
ncbi:hypothetical protein LWM68_13620 [Niabella sp. W65]|nr:hypothetical protein [Niabella sp. W65]MCH7363695.1 hypothetical protein [Niabella sp. W65]ULT46453.1 hypothetical protein KRR40_32440 [Niabella sp. I65]